MITKFIYGNLTIAKKVTYDFIEIFKYLLKICVKKICVNLWDF